MLAAFMLYPRSRREGFAPPAIEGVSTRTIFMESVDNKAQDATIAKYGNSVVDGKDMLTMSRCYQFLMPGAMDFLEVAIKPMNMVYMRFDFMASSTIDTNMRILTAVHDFHNRNNRMPIKGKVHVFMSVAPYWRDNQKRLVVTQWNSADYLSKADLARAQQLYTSMIIVFPRYIYATNGSISLSTLNPPFSIDALRVNGQPLAAYESRHKLCFIELPTADAYRTFGGCQTIMEPYESRCLGPADPKNMSEKDRDRVTPSTFVVMYNINKRFDSFMTGNIFEL